jgi:hypothetical protein
MNDNKLSKILKDIEEERKKEITEIQEVSEEVS